MEKLNKTFKINPLYESDGYKVGHKAMLAENTVREAWTWIPRNLKYMHPSIEKIMSGSGQFVARYIHSNFQEFFFDQPKSEVEKFGRDMSKYLMMEYNAQHFEDLYELGFLPIALQALPEGTFTKANIPHMCGINTEDGYAWFGLYLETLLSKVAWQISTVATIGYQFKKNAVEWTKKTNSKDLWLADFLCHDFHSRGGNPFSSLVVGLGHAFSNHGSDTLNTIPASRYYYDFDENEVPVNSVNASEHSVTCTGIFYYKSKLENGFFKEEVERFYAFDIDKEGDNVADGSVEEPDYLAIAEYLNLRDWLKKFPTGILSVVSDTFDLWKLITWILPRLKEEILSRDGKLVIRPDSGDPVDITCGLKTFEHHGVESVEFKTDWFPGYKTVPVTDLSIYKSELKGVVELLWDIFGGTVSDEGYKVLDSHIGAIYGDSINLERQLAIYERLADKKFACTNVVLGIGSYTYIMLTRDSAGYAAKGSWFETLENGVRKEFDIFKDPITDDGTKTSLKGFQFVYLKDGEYEVESKVTEEKAFSEENELKLIYKDGKFYNQVTLTEIRERLKLI